jgi:lysophospholipase L1-like esterase
MHILGARASAVCVAIALVVGLGGAIACSTGPPDQPSVHGPAPFASGVSSPSGIASPPDAAAAPVATHDAGTPTGNEAAASDGSDHDASALLPLAPFHIIGRVDTRDAARPRFGWSGTELRARFSGASLSVILADTGTSYYDVAVDGGAPVTLLVTGAAQPYALATGLAMGEHDVILKKRTETVTGVTQLFGFMGTLVATPEPAGRRIEVIGDSITCGFGVLGADQRCPFSPSTEAEPLAWGALASKELGALHMATAVSGIGVIRNFGGDTTDTMPALYDRAIANDASSSWDPRGFEPDVIVVELGTNDFEGGKGDPGAAFQATYTAFLALLRARHALAHVVAATSPMASTENRARLAAYVAGAVADRAAAGDANVSWLDIAQQSAADGYGCDWHPSVTTQQKLAAELVAHLKPRMGW